MGKFLWKTQNPSVLKNDLTTKLPTKSEKKKKKKPS